MTSIQATELPTEALLRRYDVDGGYVDCFITDIDGQVSLEQFVEAFYTTAVFKTERLLIHVLGFMPSTDVQAAELAACRRETFSAWKVEARGQDQLLMADLNGRTRSWLQVGTGNGSGTRLYFGSAIVPVPDPRTGRPKLGWVFDSLLGFHKVYSRVLLHAAKSRLLRQSKHIRR